MEAFLQDEIRNALETRQFQVWYQPQINYANGKISGAEALVRWIHPEMGIISPQRFINTAEETGLVKEIDRYVREEVCRFQKRNLSEGGTVLPVSINISRKELIGGDLPDELTDLITRYQIDVSLLHLEITESAYMEDPSLINIVVDRLRDMGFTVEMDDFGSGYSSLNTLKDVVFDVVKLDMNFLEKDRIEGRAGRIVSAMIRMVHWLDARVIAEGVETRRQAEYLKSMGCDYMQGYYFAKPMPEEDYRKILGKPDLILRQDQESMLRLEGALDFFDDSTQATIMFNSFTGCAMIAEYHDGLLEVLRINDRFFQDFELDRDFLKSRMVNIMELITPESRQIFDLCLREAQRSGKESECVIQSLPLREGGEESWSRVRTRLLSAREDDLIFYLSFDNITEQVKKQELENLLETVVRSLPAGVLYYIEGKNGQRSRMLASDRAFELFHQDAGENRFDDIRSEYDFGLSDELIEMIRNDPDYTFGKVDRLLVRKVDGSRFYLRMEIRVLREEGKLSKIYALLEDVTEEYQHRSDMDALLNSLPGGFMKYSLDEKEEVSFVSEGLLRLLGLSGAEFAEKYQKRFSTIIYEGDRERVLREIGEQLKENDCAGHECKYRVRNKGGKLLWVYDAAYVTTDQDGRKWFCAVILDINAQTENNPDGDPAARKNCFSFDDFMEHCSSLDDHNDLVRVVEPISRKVWYCSDARRKDDNFCHTVWGREERCRNCSSMKAFLSKGRVVKLESKGGTGFMVISQYIELDKRPLILELVNEIPGSCMSEAAGMASPADLDDAQINLAKSDAICP